MANKAQKVRVGLFAIASAVLLAIVLVVFGGVKFWARHDSYTILVEDSVYGLTEGAKVYFNGIHVGSVTDIELAPQGVVIEIAIERGTPVRDDTRALMRFAGITGLKEVDLTSGNEAGAQLLPPGSRIPPGETIFDQIETESTRLMERANQLVENLVEISNPKEYADLRAAATLTAQNLAEASDALHGLIAENRVALRHSIESIQQTAREAGKVFDRAGNVVGQVEGVVRDNQGSLRAAMLDLRQASRSLKDLAREVRQRPSRLLFSKPAEDRRLP